MAERLPPGAVPVVANPATQEGSGPILSAVRFWGAQGATAIFDQGLLSGTNFGISILLARWLSVEQFGAFAVAYAIFLFISGFHNALILEPMSVLGPANYGDSLSGYFRVQLKLHSVSTSFLGLLLTAAGVAVDALTPGRTELGQALVGIGLGLPFILFLWLTRRFGYVMRCPPSALAGSVAYLGAAGGGLYAIRAAGAITPISGFAVMAIASLLAGILVVRSLPLFDAADRRPFDSDWRMAAKSQWGYGRWIGAAGVLTIAAGQFQTFVVAMVSLAEAGVLRAMQNFMLPMAQAITSIGVLGLPILSADFGHGRLKQMRRKGVLITAALVGPAIGYAAVLFVARNPLELLVYGGKYGGHSSLIPIMGLVPVAIALATGFSLILRAAQWPQHAVYVALLSGGVGLATAIIFTWKWGTHGAAWSIVTAYAVSAVMTAAMYRVWVTQSSTPSDRQADAHSDGED